MQDARHGIESLFCPSVCPFVKRVLYDKTKEIYAHILYHMK